MTLDKCQIITHITHSLSFTPFEVKWIPCSAKFVVIGQSSRGSGIVQVYELTGNTIVLKSEMEKPVAFKSCTMGASSLSNKRVATGDFKGRLCIWDLENLKNPVYSVQAHTDIINTIDGAGGIGLENGQPEVATGSRDGFVKVWDVRVSDKPVLCISPAQGERKRDTWAVAFGIYGFFKILGNSFNNQERTLAAGYDNGDVKLFDLRNMSLLWETNVKNGVCSLEFDRKDIPMNKLLVAGLEASFQVLDMRTLHPTNGFASVAEKTEGTSTVWTAKHLPQNRDIFITSGGNGNLHLYKYHYPSSRVRKDEEGKNVGVAGTIEMIQKANVAEQPVNSFDWSPDKQGLCAFTAFDQSVRIGIVTKLGTL